MANGEERWQFETGNGFTGSPAVAAGRLVIADDKGVVYCFGAR
jgi:outer membrane protein assembly factor BamB